MASWHDLSLEIVSNILDHVVHSQVIYYTPVFTSPRTTSFLDTDLLSVGKSFLTEKQLHYIVSEKSKTKYNFFVRNHLDILSLQEEFPDKALAVTVWPEAPRFIKQDREAKVNNTLAVPPTCSPLNSLYLFLTRPWNYPKIDFAYQEHAKITLMLDCKLSTTNGLDYGDLNKAFLSIKHTPKPELKSFEWQHSSEVPHLSPAYIMCNLAARNSQVNEVMRATRHTYLRDNPLPPHYCIYFELELIATTGRITSQIAKFDSRFWSLEFTIGDKKHEIQQAPPAPQNSRSTSDCLSDIGCFHVKGDYLSEKEKKLFDEKKAVKYFRANVWECPVVKWRRDL